jgi:hypothetical protein
MSSLEVHREIEVQEVDTAYPYPEWSHRTALGGSQAHLHPEAIAVERMRIRAAKGEA